MKKVGRGKRIIPFKAPPAGGHRHEDDVGADAENAEAGQKEGRHLLVLGADEVLCPNGVVHRHSKARYGSTAFCHYCSC